MKLAAAFVFLGALVACSAVPSSYLKSTKTLQDDFQDIVALIPAEAILEILLDYLVNDDEFQRVLLYVLSDDFVSIVEFVDSIEEYIEVCSTYIIYYVVAIMQILVSHKMPRGARLLRIILEEKL